MRDARVTRLDGTTRLVHWRTALLTLSGGAEGALYLRDVTDERSAVEGRRRSEDNFRAIIERSPLAVCVTHGDRLAYANDALLEYLGYDADDDMVGPTLAALSDDLIDPADRSRTRDAFRGLFAALGSPDQLAPAVRIDDVRLRSRRDGTSRFCDMHGIVISHDGKPALVTYLHDQTERHANADRIRLADRMSSLGTLAAGAAHEINNPLTYVIGNLELAAERLAESPAGDGTVGEQLAAARVGLERIRKTVRSLKTFSRGDEETIGSVDVCQVLESCIEIAQSQLRHRARLVRRLQRVAPVAGNDARLSQVFLNLLVNAAQALDEATAERNEVVASVTSDGHHVLVEIADNGCGIAPEHLPRVFDPFFTTKPVGVGTGLGLFVCHGIVEALGGEIRIESTRGRGTSVRVRLPIALDVAENPAPPKPPRANVRARILAIDDEPMVLQLVRSILRAEADVETASGGAHALERVRSGEAFDLVICDLMMPGMSGADLCRHLEEERPELAPRVVFMTGGAVTDAAAAFLAAAPRAVLEKPFSPVELRMFVRRQLSERASSRMRSPI
jgi:PAS domain S-box-containing protein